MNKDSPLRPTRTVEGKGQHASDSKPQAASTHHRALAILNILEIILYRVDIQTLLTSCQAVCTVWQHAIVNSPRLQQALFFKPASYHQSTMSEGGHIASKLEEMQNPLLQKYFRPIFQTIGCGWKTPCGHFLSGDTLSPTTFSPGQHMGPAEGDKNSLRRRALVRKGASWRRMLLTEHLTSKVMFRTNFKRGWSTYTHDEIVEFPRGLRMGQLYDLLVSVLFLQPGDDSTARIVWRMPSDSNDRQHGDRHSPETRPALSPSQTSYMSDSDLTIEENYYFHEQQRSDTRTPSHNRHQVNKRQSRSKSALTPRIKSTQLFQSKEFVDGFMNFGTNRAKRLQLVEDVRIRFTQRN